MKFNPIPPVPARERGVALIIGLVMLVVLALLGTAAYSVATQDERIAGNARDHARALDAAEAMLRDCEQHIEGGQAQFTGTAGFYMAPNTPNSTWNADTIAAANSGAIPVWPSGSAYALSWQFPNVTQQPQCIAEMYPSNAVTSLQPVHAAGLPVGGAGTLNVARLTAVGYGANSNTQVYLVSYISWLN